MTTVTVRAARIDDLADAYDIFYKNEIGDLSEPPPKGDIPAGLQHALASSEMCVAEHAGRIVGFASLTTRGSFSYLSDLFVRQEERSHHIGSALLQQVLPHDGRICCTMASTDYRALALYIRAGMQPQWPNLCLRANAPAPDSLPVTDVVVVEAHVDDRELVRWDAEISGRERPQDHAFWVRDQGGVPVWFERQGIRVGYGYARLGAGTIFYPDACTIGPVGARTAEDAAACVLAAVTWAQSRATVLRIDVPGPHPSLGALLDTGFRIGYVETFMSTMDSPFVDGQRYVGSGGDLF